MKYPASFHSCLKVHNLLWRYTYQKKQKATKQQPHTRISSKFLILGFNAERQALWRGLSISSENRNTMLKPWKATGQQQSVFPSCLWAGNNTLKCRQHVELRLPRHLSRWHRQIHPKHILSRILKLKSSLPEKPCKAQPKKGFTDHINFRFVICSQNINLPCKFLLQK